MNCDLAFDLLTRGPVPAGDADTDAALERHLAACHDCRRLAEAMRPAVDLFHETMSEQDVESLPCYWGALPIVAEGGQRVAVADVPVVSTRRQVRDRRTAAVGRGSVWPLVAVGAACVMLGAGLMALRDIPQRNATVDTTRAVTALRLVDERSEQRLVALGAKDECRPTFAVSGTTGHLLQCCSVCHTADPTSSAAAQSVAIANSCVECHAPLDDSVDAAFRPVDRDGVESPGELL